MYILKFSLISTLFFLAFHTNPLISAAENPLRVAFTSVVIKENMELNARLIDYISSKLRMPVKLSYSKSYKDISTLLESGEADAGWICGAPYVIDHDRFGVELLVVPYVKGYLRGLYRSFVIVPSESPVKSFNDLKGKNYAFSDPASNSGKIVPAYMLAKMGETPDSFFKRYIYTYSHYESIQAVAEGFVDGASVDSYIYDAAARFNPEIVKKIKIVERSDWHGFTPLVMRKGLDKGLIEKIKKVFMDMENDPTGKAILEAYGFNSFINPNDSLYDSIREMMKSISQFEMERGAR